MTFLSVFLFSLFGTMALVEYTSAGQWSEWRDITLCSARPCGCPGDRSLNKLSCEDAPKGEKVQARHCIRTVDDMTPCRYKDGVGPIKKDECTSADLCPAWSEWKQEPCVCEPYQTNGKSTWERYCSIRPLHPDIECTGKIGMPKTYEKEIKDCTCQVTKTTPEPTTTTTTTTTPAPELPCCELPEEKPKEDVPLFGGGGKDKPVVNIDDIYGDYCQLCDVNGNPIKNNGGNGGDIYGPYY